MTDGADTAAAPRGQACAVLVLAAGALVARAEKDHMAGLAAAKYRWPRNG